MDDRDPTRADEMFAAALETRAARWCRARLLNALAGASDQGVLSDVLDELLDDDDAAHDQLVAALTSTGWIRAKRLKIDVSGCGAVAS